MSREKITVVNWYGIFPFDHGGKQDIRGLCKGLSEWFDVTIVMFTGMNVYRNEIYLSKHLKVVPIVMPKTYTDKRNRFYEQYGFNSNTLIEDSVAASRYFSETPELVESLRRIAENSRIVITVHPYTYRVVKEACADKIIWYRAQNVEYFYKKATWSKIANPEPLLQEVYELEKECCEGSDLILTITQDDADKFNEMYNIPTRKLLNISAGYDLSALDFTLPSVRKPNDDNYKLTAFFISSAASVAVAAAEKIVEIAKETPFVKYIIAGGVGSRISSKFIPSNVHITGIIPDSKKIEYLKTSDVAINLLDGGSGLNMKMLEYFAYGLPVITTKFGARGLMLNDKKDCLFTDETRYKEDILSFCEMPISERDEIAKNALLLLKNDYNWRNVAQKAITYLKEYHFGVYNNINPVSEQDIKLFSVCDGKSCNVNRNKKLFIWGSGLYGNSCLKYLKESGLVPVAFIDNDPGKWGSRIENIEVLPPEYFFNSNENTVIIAVADFSPILTQLLKGKIELADIIIAFNGNMLLSCETPDNFPYYIDYDKMVKKAME